MCCLEKGLYPRFPNLDSGGLNVLNYRALPDDLWEVQARAR